MMTNEHPGFPGAVRFDWASVTDPGQRKTNDDAFVVGDLTDGLHVASTSVSALEHAPRSETLHRPVLMVADGVSGQPAADTASAVTVECVVERLGELAAPDSGAAVEAVASGLVAAGGALRKMSENAERSPASSGTVAVVDWPCVDLVHVGHSRAYLMRRGRLSQLTTDHTLAHELNLPSSSAPAMHHILTRAVGTPEQTPEFRRVQLEVGDTLLVSSNGLGQTLGDEVLGAVLRNQTSASAHDRCAQLLEVALRTHGVRNITVLMLTAH